MAEDRHIMVLQDGYLRVAHDIADFNKVKLLLIFLLTRWSQLLSLPLSRLWSDLCFSLLVYAAFGTPCLVRPDNLSEQRSRVRTLRGLISPNAASSEVNIRHYITSVSLFYTLYRFYNFPSA